MSDKSTELLEAAKAVLPFLAASTDNRDRLAEIEAMGEKPRSEAVDWIIARQKEAPAERLRREADEMEAKDAAVKRFRAAVAAMVE